MLFNCLNRFEEIVRIMKFFASSAKQDCTYTQIPALGDTYTHIHMETRHILRRPRGEAKGLGELGNKAISRIPKLINCPLGALYPYSTADPQYSFGSDCIVRTGLLGQY